MTWSGNTNNRNKVNVLDIVFITNGYTLELTWLNKIQALRSGLDMETRSGGLVERDRKTEEYSLINPVLG